MVATESGTLVGRGHTPKKKGSAENEPIRQFTVLAKAPHIGKVKTRLTAELSDWQALQFHVWSLRQVVGRLCPSVTERAPLLFSTSPHEVFSTLTLALPPLSQRDGHLGLKMLHALEESFAHCSPRQQRDAVMLLGTDAPALQSTWLDEGFSFLTSSKDPSIVVGPAIDGGYYTIGCNRAALSTIRPVFDNQISWGTDEVFEQTERIIRQIMSRFKILPMGSDIDHPEDLERARLNSKIHWHELDQLLLSHPLSPPHDLIERAAYGSALKRLFSLTRFGERMDLSAPRAINKALDNPLSRYRSVLIGGTNGKGSTSAALNQLGLHVGLKVGCFTSPHLVSFRERMRIGDTLISPAQVVEGVSAVFKAAERVEITLSFFEATWALAAWFFRSQGVEWVIWEVGLGGRLDATNICEPSVSAICSLSLDHTHVLGDSLAEIAWEKSHIYREHGVALTGCEGETLKVLREVSVVQPRVIDQEREAVEALYLQRSREDEDSLSSAMISTAHGRSNMALALAIARAAQWITPTLNILDLQGWRDLKWPGRLERLEGVWLDCAHNHDSARLVSAWLKDKSSREPGRSLHLIVGMSADKDITEVLNDLASCADRLTLVSPLYPRCASASDLHKIYEDEVKPRLVNRGETPPHVEVTPSLIEALRKREVSALTLVTGSCFLVGEARAWLLGADFPELGVLTTAR